ncbi:hypothetical protein AAG906_009755 [Vitis piasezkii]
MCSLLSLPCYVVYQKGYRCYDPFTRHTYVTMDVTFLDETMVDEAPSLVSIDPTRLDGPTEHNTTSENYTPLATKPSSSLP